MERFPFIDPGDRYFECFLPNFSGGTFFDIGAYDRANSEKFLELHPNGKWQLFEPVLQQAKYLERKFENDERVVVNNYPVGAGDQEVFIEDNGETSKISCESCSRDRIDKT